MSIVQGTVATFAAGSGTVLLDNGSELTFDANAFARSGLRGFRLGQRVIMELADDRVVAITHISLTFLQ